VPLIGGPERESTSAPVLLLFVVKSDAVGLDDESLSLREVHMLLHELITEDPEAERLLALEQLSGRSWRL